MLVMRIMHEWILVLLRSLLAVADQRTISAAARALFVTRPGLSRRLRAPVRG